MTCPGCGRRTRVCVVCPAGAECPTPVCLDCAQKKLQQAKRLREVQEAEVAMQERAWLRDELAILWRRARYGVLARLGCRDLDPPWLLPGAPRNDENKPRHTTRIFGPLGQYEGNEDRYDVECDLCGWLVAADTIEEAEAIAPLHEEFVATLVEKWSVDR